MGVTNLITQLIDYIIHLDKYLATIISAFGPWTYAFLFLIIFLETGLVLTPFLPGDSLLFAVGTFAAVGSLNIWLLFILLTLAAILGDTMNYWIGHFFGGKIKKLVKKEHLTRTHAFFIKHGGKTIILARFIPIIRTIAPFLAGIGKMDYWKFLVYNVVGGIVWVGLFLWAGFFFGNIPWVQENFSIVIIVIMATSLIPVVHAIVKNWHEKRALKKHKTSKKNN